MVPSTSSERIDAAHRGLAQAMAESSTNKLKLGSGALQGDRLHAARPAPAATARGAASARGAATARGAARFSAPGASPAPSSARSFGFTNKTRLGREARQVIRLVAARNTTAREAHQRRRAAQQLASRRPTPARHQVRRDRSQRPARARQQVWRDRSASPTKASSGARRAKSAGPSRPAYNGAQGTPASDDAQRGADARCAILSPGPFCSGGRPSKRRRRVYF